MTAAEVPREARLLLRDCYDSREGQCGVVRIRAESLSRLRKGGYMRSGAMYQTSFERGEGTTGVVRITTLNPDREFFCVASIQPSAECELLIYERSVSERPDT